MADVDTIDVERAIHLLQQLKKTASPEELVALHRALLPTREVKESPYHRRSGLPPGLATRGGCSEDVLRKPGEVQSHIRQVKAERRNGWIHNDVSSDSVARLAALDLADDSVKPMSRSETPSDAEYAMGAYRPGTLRIINGCASPAPSSILPDMDTPRRAQTMDAAGWAAQMRQPSVKNSGIQTPPINSGIGTVSPLDQSPRSSADYKPAQPARSSTECDQDHPHSNRTALARLTGDSLRPDAGHLQVMGSGDSGYSSDAPPQQEFRSSTSSIVEQAKPKKSSPFYKLQSLRSDKRSSLPPSAFPAVWGSNDTVGSTGSTQSWGPEKTHKKLHKPMPERRKDEPSGVPIPQKSVTKRPSFVRRRSKSRDRVNTEPELSRSWTKKFSRSPSLPGGRPETIPTMPSSHMDDMDATARALGAGLYGVASEMARNAPTSNTRQPSPLALGPNWLRPRNKGMTPEMASELARMKSRDFAHADKPWQDKPRMATPAQSSKKKPQLSVLVEDRFPEWHSKAEADLPKVPVMPHRPQSMFTDVPPMPAFPADFEALTHRADELVAKKLHSARSTPAASARNSVEVESPRTDKKLRKKQQKEHRPEGVQEVPEDGQAEPSPSIVVSRYVTPPAASWEGNKENFRPSVRCSTSTSTFVTVKSWDPRPQTSSQDAPPKVFRAYSPSQASQAERSRAESLAKLTGANESSASLHSTSVPTRTDSLDFYDRYSGGLGYGWERGSGFQGSAGTRRSGSEGRRKSVARQEEYGLDLSDVPVFLRK